MNVPRKLRTPVFGHDDGSTWRLIKFVRGHVVLENAFTGETRRPTVITFEREYHPVRSAGAR